MTKTFSSPQPLKKAITRLINAQWLTVSIIVILIILMASYFSGKNQITSQQHSTLLLAKSAGLYYENAVNLVNALAATSPSQTDLEVVQQSNILLDSLYIIKPDGRLSAIAPNNNQLKIGMDMSRHPNFQDGLVTIIQSQPFISPRTGNPTVYISFPIMNGAGILIGELNLNGLEENLSVLNLGHGKNFYLTDSKGVFLSHPNYEMVKQQRSIDYLSVFKLAIDGIETRMIGDHGKLKLATISKIPQTGWLAITETSILSVYGVIVFPAVIGLILIGLLFWIFVRREREVIVKQVVNPISELDRVALLISQGNFSETPKYSFPALYSEIASLTSTFEFMQHSIQNHTEELRKSEEKYRTVADFTYDWEAWRLPDGSYRYVSPSCERISGHKASEFITNPNLLIEMVIPEDKPIIENHLEEIFDNFDEISHHLDFRILDTKGDIHWISHYCLAVFGDNGEFLGRRESNRDITDRKARELELEKWGQIFENADWGIAIGSADGKFVELFNPAYARMHGYEPEELVGLKIPDLFSPECRADIAENIDLAHQKGYHVWECNHIHKDGHTFPVVMDVTAVKDEKGNVKYRVVNLQDVTEKRKIENELRLSETKFSTAFRTSPDSININRLTDGLFIEINEGYTQITDYTREDVMGKTSLEINIWVNQDDRNELVKGLRENGIVNNLEAQFRTKNGAIKTCLMSATIIEVNGEKCILSITRDLTERLVTDNKLKESEERFHTLFEQAAIGVALIDTETGRYLDINKKYCEFLGYSKEEMLDITFSDVSVDEDAEMNRKNNAKLLSGEINEFAMEKQYIRKNGEIVWGQLTASPLWKASENPITHIHIAMVEDITDRKLAESTIKESELNLKLAQKYSHIGSWVWNIKTNQLDWSDEMFHIFGIDKEALPENPEAVVFSVIHPEDRAKVIEANRSVVEKGIPVPLEYRLIWPDGSVHVVWGEAGEEIFDENGVLSVLKGTVQDITERKQLEEEIFNSEQKNRLLISQMHQGLAVHEIILDENGKPVDYRFLFVNESFERLTGLRAADLIGKRVLEVLPGTEKSWIEKYGRVAITGEPIEFEDLHSELGKYYGVVAYSPQPNQFAVIVSDIADRKQKEIQLAEQMDELQRWHNITLGREDRIRDLKVEVNQLLSRQGDPIRYSSVINDTKKNDQLDS